MKLGNIAPKAGDIGDVVRDCGERRTHFEAGKAGVACVSFPFGKGAGPKGHDGVADEFVDDAIVTADDLGSCRKIAVKQTDDGVGR